MNWPKKYQEGAYTSFRQVTLYAQTNGSASCAPVVEIEPWLKI